MKLFILLNLFLLSLTVPGVAEASVIFEKTREGVIVSSFAIENVNGLESDQYICLGTGRKEENYIVFSQIRDLKKVYPKLFLELGKTETNCFTPNKVQKAVTVINPTFVINNGYK